MSDFLENTSEVPPAYCAECGYLLDAATSFEGDKPRPGDVTLCLHCGHLMAFADDLSLRPLTDAEMISVAGDPRILTLQWARDRVVNKSNAKPLPAVRRYLLETAVPILNVTDPASGENCDLVVCHRVADMPNPPKAHGNTARCRDCNAPIWLSPRSPKKPPKVCFVCARNYAHVIGGVLREPGSPSVEAKRDFDALMDAVLARKR